MKFHSSANFEASLMPFHNEFSIDVPFNEIQKNQVKIINHAIYYFKEKCENYFKIDFSKMIAFEVYFFSGENEIPIFKKVKTATT